MTTHKSIFIYYDINYKNNFGHWSNILDYVKLLSEKYQYEFIHIKDEYYDLQSFFEKLRMFNNVVFYSYFFEDIEKFVLLHNLAKTYCHIKFFVNYLPLIERGVKYQIEYFRKNLSFLPNYYILADTENLYNFLKNTLTVQTLFCSCPILPITKDTYQPSRKTKMINIGYYFNKQADSKTLFQIMKVILDSYPQVMFNIKIRPDQTIKEFTKNYVNFGSSERINIFQNFIDKNDYYEYLQMNDIVILNYEKDEYFYRSSGVFIESLYFKKIILTIEGTWMNSILKKFGNGECYLRDNLDSIIYTLKHVIENFHEYHKKSVTSYNDILTYFDSRKLFNHKLIQIEPPPKKLLLIYCANNQHIYEYPANLIQQNATNYKFQTVFIKNNFTSFVLKHITNYQQNYNELVILVVSGGLILVDELISLEKNIKKNFEKLKIFLQIRDTVYFSFDAYKNHLEQQLKKIPSGSTLKLCSNSPNSNLNYLPFPVLNDLDLKSSSERDYPYVIIVLPKIESKDQGYDSISFNVLNMMKIKTPNAIIHIWTPNKMNMKNRKLLFRFRFIHGITIFKEMLKNNPLIILPCSPDTYKTMIPEFGIEAIHQSCPILTTRKTSLETIVKEFGIGSCYQYGDMVSLISEYEKIMSVLPQTRDKYVFNRKKILDILDNWTVQKFFESIIITE